MNTETTIKKLPTYKRLLYAIPIFILWILYFTFTMEKRDRYIVGKSRGMKCTHTKDVSWFFPGNTVEYYFDPTQKPEREYVTWTEFWESRGY